MSNDQMINFSFSEMTTDQLNSEYNDPFSMTGAMPSSPPPELFSFLNNNGSNENAMWDDMIDPNGHSAYPDPEGLTVTATNTQPLRKSPRKQRAN